MNDPTHKALTELFAGDSDELVDDAFVQRCVTSFRRARRRLLILKLIVVCAAAGTVGLVASLLADSVAAACRSLAAVFTAVDLTAIVPSQFLAAFAALDGALGGIDRAAVTGVVLVLIVRRYGIPFFRPRQTRF